MIYHPQALCFVFSSYIVNPIITLILVFFTQTINCLLKKLREGKDLVF